MCKEHLEDLKLLEQAADSLAEAASSLTASGGQAYTGFVHARSDFVELLHTTAKNYRRVAEVSQ